MILYPAIDIKDGQAVRLVQGDFAQDTVFSADPVSQARAFAQEGATHLHVVDLDGAKSGEPVHAPLVASIVAAFGGVVHLGGGLRSRASIETAVAAGARRAVVGTAALQDPELLRWAIQRLGDGLVVALDARDGKVATHGWTQVSDEDAEAVAERLVSLGVRHLLYTDISRDGMLEGPNLPALRRLCAAAPPISVIASGGIARLDDLRHLASLGMPNLAGVIVGSALYRGRFTVADALAELSAVDTGRAAR
ncbi:MAG: 1-(5-phosphoribosyl)-5-[(5-phosphoribosylamino)methylideneamino]imidazole-4-carboxamide isomerase [Thermoleophilia bacterium]|nr:1-(5-phosphoribosyl)-5-[(5-phosphoribosylamino)methylideneamino]imidazole-4-carboxamide isomerase [Thermoleophilia bacterium]